MPSTIRKRLAGLRRDPDAAGRARFHPDDFGATSRPVVAVCHPEWFGIRASTHAMGLPVAEAADLDDAADQILVALAAADTSLVVVNGFPPGTAAFARRAAAAGVAVRVLMHSSMTQHGYEPDEARIIADLFALHAEGAVDAVGFSKEGQAEAFVAMGYPATYVPPRIVAPAPVQPADLGPGRHVGIFGEAAWHKNVTVQIGAAAILGATAHVSVRPDVEYLDRARVVTHGTVDHSRLLSLLAGTDLNLAVTLYECFPVLPQESYALGTPCLVSRTSALFKSDPVLWELSTIGEHDNPRIIAAAAERLLDAAAEEGIVERARAWMERWQVETAPAWDRFVEGPA